MSIQEFLSLPFIDGTEEQDEDDRQSAKLDEWKTRMAQQMEMVKNWK